MPNLTVEVTVSVRLATHVGQLGICAVSPTASSTTAAPVNATAAATP